MATPKKKSNTDEKVNRRTPITTEGRESQMISLAMGLAEQQLRDGTASSQVITHFLKLGTEQAKLERAKLEHENRLLEAKTDAINSGKNLESMYKEAIAAMQSYRGRSDDDDSDY